MPAHTEKPGPSYVAGLETNNGIETNYGKPPRALDERLTAESRTALAQAYASGVKQKDLAHRYEISIRSVKRLIQRARATGVI